ncbi:nucleoside kinase [uncultured Oscillibacter sp.]|uniref:nucleoside kinase n=1 Tax=uncultured Oscillibacter sp. TaxID=876091 RepID=UPI0034273509
MEEKRMIKVTVDGADHAYPSGTPYRAVAADFQDRYPWDILLVNRDGKLCELHKTLDRDCSLKMVTAQDKPGIQTYERSAVFLMLKAFYDVVGRENVERISVEYSLSSALFILARGNFTLDQALLTRVEARMRELSAAAVPIEKRSVNTDDAIELFRQAGLIHKAQLLSFRINSRVNVYSLDGFVDYFYGYMVPDSSYIKCFGLELFENGFVLRLPTQRNPNQLGDFLPSRKVFRELYASTLRSEALNASNVAELNTTISQGGATPLILAHEAMMEKKIGDIAEEIAGRKDVRFVMIAGPSSSGKTTFSHRLSTQLRACGLRPYPIATDNYFKNREDTPRDENGNYDFEGLGAMDVEQFNQDCVRLLNGETVELPTFNFKKGAREYNGNFLKLGDGDVLVIEGIHCLNDQFTHALPKESKYKIYISCLTTLNIDDHNRIPTTDARLLRRIERDARTRGYSAQATIKMWPSVRRGEENNIFPFQDSADTVFNSALIYETALLKPYVQPLLFGVPRDSEEYIEAKRLLKFLNYFLPIPADNIPKTSLMREFVGGGCYHV